MCDPLSAKEKELLAKVKAAWSLRNDNFKRYGNRFGYNIGMRRQDERRTAEAEKAYSTYVQSKKNIKPIAKPAPIPAIHPVPHPAVKPATLPIVHPSPLPAIHPAVEPATHPEVVAVPHPVAPLPAEEHVAPVAVEPVENVE